MLAARILAPGSELRGIVFDVDGTLYRQSPVRHRVMLQLGLSAFSSPWAAVRDAVCISAYRRAHEALRGQVVGLDVFEAQAELASAKVPFSTKQIKSTAKVWMEEKPLDFIRSARCKGLVRFLAACGDHQLKLGVLSDYPPLAKLEALEVRSFFHTLGWAQMPEIGALKPNPAGLSWVLDQLGVAPWQSLYVGDRPEIDGSLAQSVGAQWVIAGTGRQQRHRAPTEALHRFTDYDQLHARIFG